jgi:hypothetical protein
MLYSLKDIQLALSAADFLQSCDPDEKISKVELRRFKCYETTAIVSYARPFSESRGVVPKLSLKMIGLRLDAQHLALHNRILDLCNRVIAHSDAQMMRMVVGIYHLDIGRGETMPVFNPAFDEGLEFVGFGPVSDVLTLFHTVYGGIFETLLEDARANPDSFAIRHDYLDPEGR